MNNQFAFLAGPILPTTAQRDVLRASSDVNVAIANGDVEQVGPAGSQAEIPVDGHMPGPGGMYPAGFMRCR